ncbi:MAG: BrnA antitoxin family protein [Bryobacteraceae bacterium]
MKRRKPSKNSVKRDLARIDRMRDAYIDYSDIPPLGDEFLKKATVAWPPVKKQLTIRLDADVLEWLKGHGRGYQTRINRILRVAMESQGPRAKR